MKFSNNYYIVKDEKSTAMKGGAALKIGTRNRNRKSGNQNYRQSARITLIYHMTRTAPRALSLQNYCENPRMRAVRDGASRAGKSRPALLGSRTALIRGFSQ